MAHPVRSPEWRQRARCSAVGSLYANTTPFAPQRDMLNRVLAEIWAHTRQRDRPQIRMSLPSGIELSKDATTGIESLRVTGTEYESQDPEFDDKVAITVLKSLATAFTSSTGIPTRMAAHEDDQSYGCTCSKITMQDWVELVFMKDMLDIIDGTVTS